MLMQHDLTVGSHLKVIQYWSKLSANKKMSKIWRPYLDDENVEEPGERNVEEIEKSGCVNSKTCMRSQLCGMCKKIVLNVNNYIEQTEGKGRGKGTVKKNCIGQGVSTASIYKIRARGATEPKSKNNRITFSKIDSFSKDLRILGSFVF